MKDYSKVLKEHSRIIAALILGVSIIIAAFLYYEANRYEISTIHQIDKYKGTYKRLESAN